MNTSTFITKAIAVHGHLYDYEAAVYVNAKTAVAIVCTTHGVFYQQPELHICRRAGCPMCAYERRACTRRKNTPWLSFDQARAVVRAQQFKNITQWNKWCKSSDRPINIPACPKVTYKHQWNGWGDWLGNCIEWLSFEAARDVVRTFGLRSYEDWVFFCNTQQRKPPNVPFEPKKIYKDEWIGWADWLGYTSRSNGALPGMVYVLQHPSLPQNVIKVGRSYRLDKRLYEHNRITQQSMVVLATFETQDMAMSEKQAHEAILSIGKRFKYLRHKEYFEVRNVEEAIAAIKTAIA